MTRPRSDLEALRVDLRAAYNGDPWHGPSITGVLEGITAETAGQRPIPGAHTISSTRGERPRPHASACSRPPLPTTRTRVVMVYAARGRTMV